MPSPSAGHWLDKADEDEKVVAILVANRGPWGIAAFHVQQAAEKYIKAVLVERGVAPPKTHDLTGLLSLLAPPVPLEVQNSAGLVEAYAWATRYPGSPPIGEAKAMQAVKDLEVIKKWVLKNL